MGKSYVAAFTIVFILFDTSVSPSVWCSSAKSLQGDRWLRLPSMPTARAGAAVAVLGKQILVVGGVGEDQSPLKVVEIYNTEEGRWRKRSSLREAMMGVSITVKGTSYFTISSRQDAKRLSKLKAHTLCLYVCVSKA